MACKGLRDEYAKLIQDPTHGAGYPVGRSGRSGDALRGAREEGRKAYRFVLCLGRPWLWTDATGVLSAGWAQDGRELKRYVVWRAAGATRKRKT
ncbi:hypothetical protein ON010_g18288 [Phytophthora cinnamomi]|nr:hypothetical protein ON010_g18288 [Phytophthora cinnamomi]